MNIVDPILFHSRYQPEALAICAPGIDLVTYGRLEITVNNFVRRAVSEGMVPGQVVALFVNQPVFHAALVIALARIGVVTASIGTNQLPQGLQFDAIVTDRSRTFAGARTLLADSSWAAGDGRPANVQYVAKGSDICRIMLTSGTTGEVKGIAVSHDVLVGRLLRYNTVYGSKVPRCSRVFCDLAWSTALAYQFFLYTLGRGGAFFVRGDTAENTLRALEFYRVDHLVAAPSGLAEFVEDYDRYRCQQVIDVVHAAGGAMTNALKARVRGRIGSNLICDYGSAETSCVASAPMSALDAVPGAVGYVTPGMTVEIVDESDRPLGRGQQGIVRIRGDYAATGYVNDAAASARLFRGGWFYPGDLGSLTQDGLLVISGRQSSVLNLGGEKISPEIVEDVLASFGEGLEAAAVAMIGQAGVEEVWAVVASRQPIDEDRLRQYCQSRLARIFVPKRFITVERLPRNEMGKLDRHQIEQMVRRT